MKPAAAEPVQPGLRLIRAADLADAGNPNRERHERADALCARGQRLEQFLVHHRLPAYVRHINNRACAGHGDRFFKPPGPNLGIDIRGESRGQLEAFADHRGERLQRECHRVGAGPQLREGVAAFPVGESHALLFDERGARGRNGDAGDDTPTVISHDTGNT